MQRHEGTFDMQKEQPELAAAAMHERSTLTILQGSLQTGQQVELGLELTGCGDGGQGWKHPDGHAHGDAPDDHASWRQRLLRRTRHAAQPRPWRGQQQL